MRAIWTILALVVAAGIAAIVWPEGEHGAVRPAAIKASAPAIAPAPAPTTAAPKAAAPTPAVTPKPEAPGKPKVRVNENGQVIREMPPKLAAPPAGGLTLGLDRRIPNASITPGALMRQPDGSILADGKFRIEGEGTREKPYRVSWECLASAGQTYQPRQKENAIPQRVAMLDGAWIRIDGYFAIPLMLQESSEILVMLNQWDGCCIGVPPTPYDALEAKLVEPVKANRRHAFNFGTVTGRLKVDPLLVENWLVGLYQLEEATLTQEGM